MLIRTLQPEKCTVRSIKGSGSSSIMHEAEFEPQTTIWSIARRSSFRRACSLLSFHAVSEQDDVSLLA